MRLIRQTVNCQTDYHLFRSMSHGLSEQRFQSFEDVEKWVKEWIKSEDEAFYRYGVRLLSEIWGKVMTNEHQYFD
ncbi:hypothetical protein ANCDUO_27183 [Ancylostoma duodenale]|uniref:Uncharacterized protein n=1 Tax=Ancylostoma duodenale TaxID=51022 RepID=A0A0C2BZM9_9BILA|nr:hypothetical protein ANCDUO_27183 [Ancylostoma duodenale]